MGLAEGRSRVGGGESGGEQHRAEETCYLITQAEWTSAGGKISRRLSSGQTVTAEMEGRMSRVPGHLFFFFFFSEKAHFERLMFDTC